jgi:hypothetical protein
MSAVGTYPITCTIKSLSASNYTFKTFAPGQVTVSPVTLTVTPTPTSGHYGGPISTIAATISGFVAGDHVQVVSGKAACTTVATLTSPVGTYASSCQQGSLSAHNYTFSFKPGTYKVTPATLTVTAKSATKPFGAVNPTLTYTITGFVAGNLPTVVTGKATCTTTATKTSAAGTYPITCSKGTLAAPNYTFTFKPGTLSITGGQVLPTIKALSRTSGPTTGGTSVTVTGTLFSTVVHVRFGTTTAKSYTLKSTTQLVATSPAHAAGTTRVSVTTAKGTTPITPADNFKFVIPPPAVTGLSPASGPAAGGTTITVSGTALTGASAVFFGTTKVTTTLSVNAGGTQLTVKSPAGPSGASVDVRVMTTVGESPIVGPDLFTYGPTITSLSRTSGPHAGGTKVTIAGAGFSAVTSVKFGTVAAQSYTISSSTSIVATSPAHAAGQVRISVATADGTTPATNADLFTFT